MDLPPPIWLTLSHQAQRDLISQLGELLQRHLLAQRLGATHESCCCPSTPSSDQHGDGLRAAIDSQSTGSASREYPAAISTGRARESPRLASTPHRGGG